MKSFYDSIKKWGFSFYGTIQYDIIMLDVIVDSDNDFEM